MSRTTAVLAAVAALVFAAPASAQEQPDAIDEAIAALNGLIESASQQAQQQPEIEAALAELEQPLGEAAEALQQIEAPEVSPANDGVLSRRELVAETMAATADTAQLLVARVGLGRCALTSTVRGTCRVALNSRRERCTGTVAIVERHTSFDGVMRDLRCGRRRR